jgi:phosphatidylglycerol:prolipoprotein diacylglycerol transferase
MIAIGVDPYLKVASFSLPLWALFVLSGFLLGLYLVLALAGRYALSTRQALALYLAALPGGFVGARLLHIIDKLDLYLAEPGLIPAFWLGGLAQYGFLIGGVATAALWACLKRWPIAPFLDLSSLALLAGLALGRIGCIIQGCCYGSPTHLPWGFIYTHPDSSLPPDWIAQGTATHPVPIYEAILFLALLGILLALRRRLRPSGTTFLAFLAGHSLVRFAATFLRGDPSLPIVAGLAQAQFIALAVFLFSVPLLVISLRRGQAVRLPL